MTGLGRKGPLLAAVMAILSVVPALVLVATSPSIGQPPQPHVPPLAIVRWQESQTLADRPLFLTNQGAHFATTMAPPQLVGIVGRVPHDAVVLVRKGDGSVQTLAVGASSEGWTLAAIARDATLFTRGPLTMRVDLPMADDEDDLQSN